MAAALLMEVSRGFETTFGFKSESGFKVAPMAPPAPAAPPPPPLLGLDVLPLEVSRMAVAPRSSGDAATPLARGVGSTGSVGWTGLMEISRASGGSGVMGLRDTSGELENAKDSKLEICCTPHTNPAIRKLVKAVIRGLKACQEPEAALDGMGGTYFFLNDAGRKAAIIKPCDEEPLAPNNPKGYVGRQLGEPGWKPTVRVGEAAMREVAAYLLDHDGFARVPTSVLVRARHPIFCYNSRAMGSACRSSLDLGLLGTSGPTAGGGTLQAGLLAGLDGVARLGPPAAAVDGDAGGGGWGAAAAAAALPSLPMKLGSLQEFVQHECDTSEMGASRFSASDVHRIGILDLRLFNTDRHAGNMLVCAPRTASTANLTAGALFSSGACKYELVPIDHGFCLPETLESPYFEWLHWPQAMQPFTEEELAYIQALDVQADMDLLRLELPNLRPECLRVLEVSTTLLQAGAAAGLTLYEVASVMSRRVVAHGDEEPSQLEAMVAVAKELAQEWAGHDDAASTESADGFDEHISRDEMLQGLEMDISPVAEDDGEGGRPSRRRGGDDSLFDFDDDGHGGPMVKPRPGQFLAVAVARSPGGYSVGSSTSSADHVMGFDSMPTTPGEAPGGGGGMGSSGMLPPPRTPASSVARGYVPLARSVALDGFGWRHHQKQRRHGAAAAAAAGGPATLRPAPQAYPPPVRVGAKPSSAGGVFSDLEEPQWQAFMAALRGLIHKGLRSGNWRAASRDACAPAGGVAMSCPRF